MFPTLNLNSERQDCTKKFSIYKKIYNTMEDMFLEELYSLLPETFYVLMSHSRSIF